MDKDTVKELIHTFSGYATHKGITVSEWLKVQDMKRNDGPLQQRYEHYMKVMK